MSTANGEITRLLRLAANGEKSAAEDLAPLIYDELRARAAAFMRREPDGHVLQTTALVHEAWIDLAGPRPTPWEDRNHFFAAAARVMRHILIDVARKNASDRNGGNAVHIPLEEHLQLRVQQNHDFQSLHEALSKLEILRPRQGKVVEMRYYAGMTEAEIASVLGVSDRTVKRDWDKARAWLHLELSHNSPSHMSQTGDS